MTALLTGALVSVLSLAVLAFMVWRAPSGFQDSEGFHEGDEHASDDNLGI